MTSPSGSAELDPSKEHSSWSQLKVNAAVGSWLIRVTCTGWVTEAVLPLLEVTVNVTS